MNYFKSVVLTILIFLGSQLLIAVALTAIFSHFQWPEALLLGLALLLADVVACPIVHFCLRTTKPRYLFRASFAQSPLSKWRGEILIFIGAMLAIFGMNILQEQLNLPDPSLDQVLELAFNPIGAISICLAGPICEEFIFREGIQGHLQRQGLTPWKAILVSAASFAFVHMNPAQISFALVVGIILSVAYWKTGNLVLCTIIHIFNNSLSVVMLWINGKEAAEERIDDWLGGPTISWIAFAVIILVCTLLFRYISRQKSIAEA